MILPLLLVASLTRSPAPLAASPPAARWTTFGFTAPDPEAVPEPRSAAAVVGTLLRGGGLLGGGKPGGSSTRAWGPTLETVPEVAREGNDTPDAPVGWFSLDARTKESGAVVFTLDLNAFRSGNDALFDAPWLQRALHRLAIDNARTVSIRGAVLPPPSDHLPPALEVKAFATARSNPPAPAKTITLISAGWTGTTAERAGVENANWAASLRFDTGGLGAIGPDGGVGTLAGLIRLCVDMIGTAGSADTAVWAKTYTAWQERSGDEVRSLSTRLQPRGTLACYGPASAPELVLILPARRGERAETLGKAMDQLAACGGIDVAKGVWTWKGAGPLSPRLAATVCDAGAPGVFLVATVERSPDHALLQQTAARIRQAK